MRVTLGWPKQVTKIFGRQSRNPLGFAFLGELLKRIFALAAAGYGSACIVKKLTEEGIRPFGTGGRWSRTYVVMILADRRAEGAADGLRRIALEVHGAAALEALDARGRVLATSNAAKVGPYAQ